jgi:hypothetical protein
MASKTRKPKTYDPLFDGVDPTHEAAEKRDRLRKKTKEKRNLISGVSQTGAATRVVEGSGPSFGEQPTETTARKHDRLYAVLAAEADIPAPPPESLGPPTPHCYVTEDLRSAAFTAPEGAYPAVCYFDGLADGTDPTPDVPKYPPTKWHRLTADLWRSIWRQAEALHDQRWRRELMTREELAVLMERVGEMANYAEEQWGWKAEVCDA